MKAIKDTWNSIPPIAQTIIIIGGGWLAYKKGKKVMDRIKMRKDVESYSASSVPVIVTQNGQQITSNINLRDIASQIYDAFFNNDWFGWTEDEQRAAETIAKVPKAYIKQLMVEYNKAYNRNLHDDMVKYLSPSQYNLISFLFN